MASPNTPEQLIWPLIQRLGADPGDQDAWMRLYKEMWPFVLAINYRFLRGNRELAEDATQKIFIKLIEHGNFKKFETAQHFRSYVERMCKSASVDSHRGEVRKREVPLYEDSKSSDMSSSLIDRLALEQSIGKLKPTPEEERLLRLFFTGYTLEEMAKLIGSSTSTIHRKMKVLAHRLVSVVEGTDQDS